MKATRLFLVLLLLLGLMGPASAGSLHLPLLDPSQPILSAVGVGDSLYALLASGDILMATEQEPAFVPYARGLLRRDFAYPASQNLDRAIAVLLNIDEQLHGINLASGVIYRISAAQGQAVLSEAFRLDWPRELAPGEEGGHLYPKPISHVTVAGGKLLLIHADQNAPTPGTAYTYLFDLASGQGSKLAFENARHIASSDGQTLWAGVLADEHLEIHHLNLITGQGRLVARMKRLTGGFVTQGPDLLCADDAWIWRITETGETHKLSQVPASFDLNTAGQIINQRFLIAGPERVDLISLTQGAELASLTIYGTVDQAAHQAFQRSHPQVALRQPVTFFENTDSLVELLLTRDDSYDLFFLNTRYLNPAPLFQKGYFVDLGQSDLLREKMARLYPAIAQAITREGQICAAPVALELFAPSLFPDVQTDKLPGSALPATFTGFLQMVRAWYALGLDDTEHSLVSLYQPRSWLLDTLLRQYINWYQHQGLPLSFDTPLFRQILEDYEATLPHITSDRRGGDETPALFYPAVTDLLAQGSWTNWQPFSLTPEAMDPAPLKASLSLCLINPYSNNIPLALRYVENLMEHMEPLSQTLLYPGVSEPLIRPGYEEDLVKIPAEYEKLKAQIKDSSGARRANLEDALNKLQTRLTEIQQYGYLVSPQALEIYKNHLAPRLYFPGPGILDTIGDAPAIIQHEVDRYAQGQIPLDQFIQQLEQKVRLMRLEGEE